MFEQAFRDIDDVLRAVALRDRRCGELDQEKLTPLLHLKYQNSISDAVTDLSKPEEIRTVFTGFQKYLYQVQPAA